MMNRLAALRCVAGAFVVSLFRLGDKTRHQKSKKYVKKEERRKNIILILFHCHKRRLRLHIIIRDNAFPTRKRPRCRLILISLPSVILLLQQWIVGF